MHSLLRQLQDWYKSNCNGDWEHNYGIEIVTLDNPGWAIKFSLQETILEDIEISRKFQNLHDENDWFNFEIQNGSLNIACGPENLEQVLTIFFAIIKESNLNY